MNTLKNHTLIYDEDCPLCILYTAGFIKAKMLDNNGRKPFNQICENETNFIDIAKSQNEIALVDNENKKVYYGIDSLLKVIGYSFPWIEKVGNIKLINYFLKKLYQFISYNRKVIAPNKIANENVPQCIPDFNLKYRLFYIGFATLFTALILFHYAHLITLLPNSNFGRELLLALGQIGFQYLFIQKLTKEKQINYIGNIVTVSVIGSLILVPILLLNQFFLINEYVVLGWFGLTVTIMIFEHYRRVNILKLPKYLTATWILYRLLTLIIILNF